MRIPGIRTARRLAGELEYGVRALWDTRIAKNPAGTNLHRPDGQIIKLGSKEWLLGPGKNTFSKAVLLDHDGEVPDVRKLKGFTIDNYWAYAPLGLETMMTGHYYLALNLVGSFSYTVKQALELMGANVNELFPMGGASGGTGVPLKVGDELHLTLLRDLSNVDVVYTCVSFFTLRTQIIHPLVGIAVHGVFHDMASNTIWMFQEGFGYPMDHQQALLYLEDPGYGVFDQLRGTELNYDPARIMWIRFAEKMRAFLETKPTALSR